MPGGGEGLIDINGLSYVLSVHCTFRFDVIFSPSIYAFIFNARLTFWEILGVKIVILVLLHECGAIAAFICSLASLQLFNISFLVHVIFL